MVRDRPRLIKARAAAVHLPHSASRCVVCEHTPPADNLFLEPLPCIRRAGRRQQRYAKAMHHRGAAGGNETPKGVRGLPAVQTDNRDGRVFFQQPAQIIRPRISDRTVGGAPSFAGCDHIPKREMVRREELFSPCIVKRINRPKDRKDDLPELIPRVGVVLLPSQRLLARKASQDQCPRRIADDRRQPRFSTACLPAGGGAHRPQTFRAGKTCSVFSSFSRSIILSTPR